MRYLREQGVAFTEHRYEHRVKGAAYAAEALGLDAAMVAKTLVAELDDGFAFALVPGDRELSLRGLARAAGARSAALASERDAQRLTGYQIGGISPFGSRTALPVVRAGRVAGARASGAQRRGAWRHPRAGGRGPVRLLSPTTDPGVGCRRSRARSPRAVRVAGWW